MALQILRSLVRFLQHPFFGPKISFKISRVESLSGHMLYSPCGPIGQGVWLRIRRLGVQVPPGIIFWGISSIGRVRALQARGTGIETLMLHFFYSDDEKNGTQNVIKYLILVKLLLLWWPSGPKRLTQVQVSSDAWVRIPLQAVFVKIKDINLRIESC